MDRETCRIKKLAGPSQVERERRNKEGENYTYSINTLLKKNQDR